VLVEPGQKVPVGTPLAIIESAAADATPRADAPVSRELRASPGARKAAEAAGVDLKTIQGTGPGGSITREDVDRAAVQPQVAVAAPGTPAVPSPSSSAASESAKTAMRSAIAAAMSRSKREIPHLYLAIAIDLSRMTTWLAAENATRPLDQRLLPIVPLIKAVALAAREVPEVNGFWEPDGFHPGAGVHVGCAIALRAGGLVAPAIHDADRKDLDTVMRELSDLVERARRGTLRSSELSDPTITVSNLGDLGVDTAFAILQPPQVAIVALGRVARRAWAVDDRVEVRPVINASISADHRAVDGRRAGQYLTALERRLQAPETL
jgi:pyruvate dehydrogenase E2 component (dihydrolipoamide acetyltransferase)